MYYALYTSFGYTEFMGKLRNRHVLIRMHPSNSKHLVVIQLRSIMILPASIKFTLFSFHVAN